MEEFDESESAKKGFVVRHSLWLTNQPYSERHTILFHIKIATNITLVAYLVLPSKIHDSIFLWLFPLVHFGKKDKEIFQMVPLIFILINCVTQ